MRQFYLYKNSWGYYMAVTLNEYRNPSLYGLSSPVYIMVA